MQQLHTNIAIIGGGIAGLWLFRRLCDQGVNVALIEHDALGAGQTLASQGMVHGGQRYTLQGIVSKQAKAVASMPAVWAGCLYGKGIIDLHAVHRLSDFQLMWSSGSLSSKLATHFASKVMRAQMTALPHEEWPRIFRHPDYKGSIYRMDEVVLDIASTIKALVGKNTAQVYRAAISDYILGEQGLRALILDNQYELNAERFIFTAGEGNEKAVSALHIEGQITQRRPLKQVMVKGDLPPLYGHCIAADNQPRFTITAHPLGNEKVWYLGGKVSEQGVKQGDETLIRTAKAELIDVFPRVNWHNKQWATLPIDRAEPFHPQGLRPEEPVIRQAGNTFIAWPTKLTLAPALAERLLEQLDYHPTNKDAENTPLPLAHPEIGQYPWETAQWKNAP